MTPWLKSSVIPPKMTFTAASAGGAAGESLSVKRTSESKVMTLLFLMLLLTVGTSLSQSAETLDEFMKEVDQLSLDQEQLERGEQIGTTTTTSTSTSSTTGRQIASSSTTSSGSEEGTNKFNLRILIRISSTWNLEALIGYFLQMANRRINEKKHMDRLFWSMR